MFERSNLTLDGIDGMVVDRSDTGWYWEGTLEPLAIKQFTGNKRHKPVPVHINGEAAGFGVIQQSWFNLETGSILVKFLFERRGWLEEPLKEPRRRREDRLQKEVQTAHVTPFALKVFVLLCLPDTLGKR